MHTRAEPVVMSPMLTSVASLFITTPALFNPMNAIYIPIPTLIEFLRVSGITSTIFSRRLDIVSRMNNIPSMNTAVRANCHE